VEHATLNGQLKPAYVEMRRDIFLQVSICCTRVDILMDGLLTETPITSKQLSPAYSQPMTCDMDP
jgi:hypothetical protein